MNHHGIPVQRINGEGGGSGSVAFFRGILFGEQIGIVPVIGIRGIGHIVVFPDVEDIRGLIVDVAGVIHVFTGFGPMDHHGIPFQRINGEGARSDRFGFLLNPVIPVSMVQLILLDAVVQIPANVAVMIAQPVQAECFVRIQKDKDDGAVLRVDREGSVGIGASAFRCFSGG